jgi:hypothetical protein
MHQRFSEQEEFRRGNVFYNEHELVTCINRLAADHIEMARLNIETENFERLKFDYQARRYIEVLRPQVLAR